MMYPQGPADETERTFIRYRIPKTPGPAAAAFFVGTGTTLSSMARYEAGGSGQMIDATDMAWFSIDDYGGFVDVVQGDILLWVERQFNYEVTTAEEEGPYLKITMKSTTRAGRR